MTLTADAALLLVSLLALIGLLVTVLHDPYINRKQRGTLLTIIGLCFLLMVQNYTEDWLSAGEPRILVRTMVAILGYALRPVVIVFFCSIVAPKKRSGLVWTLIVVNACVYMTALFSKVAFYITEENHWSPGPLRYVCLYVSLILLGYLLYLTILGHTRENIGEITIPVIALMLILLGIWLDSVTDSTRQRIAYLTVTMVISSIFLYIWLHIQFVREHEDDLKAQQRIRIMMSQIKPHFLFNALNTIRALYTKDPHLADKTIEGFSMYLRQNLESLGQPELIPLSKELEHTRFYAEIEMLQYPSIRVEFRIGDEDLMIPSLTIQPLVENAIRHGVRSKEHGLVTIDVQREEGGHRITIADNGVGFDPSAPRSSGRTHIGMDNVRNRVEQMCGGSMTVESEKGKGTTVTLWIPFNHEKDKRSGV